MDICSKGHDEICYDERRHRCPLCAAKETIAELDKDIEKKEAEIKELDEMVNKLESDRCNSYINHVGNPCIYCGKSCADYPDAEFLPSS